MTTSIRTSADGLSSIIAVNGVDRFSIDQNGKITAPKFAGDGSELTGILKSGTAINTTSGTSHDFTGIPSWAKRITILLSGVSTSGTSSVALQIGDSGGLENTGYLGSVGYVGTAASSFVVYAGTHFEVTRGGAAVTLAHGRIVLELLDATSNVWTCSSHLGDQAANNYLSAGSKALSTTLDRIRLTTVNGTDTFDAGSFNILYE